MGCEEERWSARKINELKGTPWKPNPEVEDANLYCNVKLPIDNTPVEPTMTGGSTEVRIRRVRISPEDATRRGDC